MERLTTNNGGGHYLDLSDNPFSYDEIVCKLGAFEDFMEEQDIPNLQILKDTLYQANLELYKMQALEDRWGKILQLIKEIEDKPFKNLKPLYVRGYKDCIKKIKKEMQELEKGE